jgi:Core-2/I-Branching enzyme
MRNITRKKSKPTKKIGFLFLIYDTINLEEAWHTFFESVDPAKYGIYIHYKQNKPLKYFDKYKLSKCVRTNYGKVSILHAHNLLFKKAYEDGCYKMINLSQACIPFKNFNHIYDFLTRDDLGYFNTTKENIFPRCDALLKYYDKDTIKKSSEWFILNRKLGRFFAYYDKDKINKMYAPITFTEEHFYITEIFDKNMQDEVKMTDNLSNGATTFTNWYGDNYKYPSSSALKNYNRISAEELEYLLGSRCLFGRKFNTDCEKSLGKKYMDAIRSPP